MSGSEKKEIVSSEDVFRLLDVCYGKCLQGLPKVSESVEDLANDYLKKYKTKEEACKAMMRNQVIKCTTSGFLSGIGGVITVPVAIPANVGSVLYFQMRMIACSANMFGYDLTSDQTRTFVYACLAGVSVNQIVKKFSVNVGVKTANNLVKKIPGSVLTKINQKVGFRFVTKFGSKGAVNLGKVIPVFGAIIGGGLDLVETKVIANRAYKWFGQGDFEVDDKEEVLDNLDDLEIDELSQQISEED